MQGGTRASFTPAARAEDLGAPPRCELSADGNRAQCSGMCHPGLRQAREAAWHPSDRRASPSAGECSRGGGSCGDRPGPTVAGSRLGPAGASGVVDLCHPGLRHAREAAWHVPDERASLPAGEGSLCGGEHGDRSDSTVLGAGLGLLAGAPAACGMCRHGPRQARVAACHFACCAPWHPQEGQCMVPRAGPEQRAGWARWRVVGTGAAPGFAPGTTRAIRLAQTHTICCACCGDLVPLQKARKAADVAGRGWIGASDGCYGCGRHSRKARRTERQCAMALAVLAGKRVLLVTPASAESRIELWMLTRAEATQRARLVLSKYQPQGLGRWLAHSCRYGA